MPIAQIIELLVALTQTAAAMYEKANGPNAIAEDAAEAITALGTVLTQAKTAAALVQTLQTENRDATAEEIASIDGAFAAADAKLSADINAA